MRNRVPHLSLLTQFSILSLLCVVAIGTALVLVLRDQIHDRAAANSRVTAGSIANDIAIEALKHGIAIVASRIGGMRDVVEEGRNGFLCELSPGAFAKKLGALLADASLLERMRHASRQMGGDYDLEKTVVAYENVLRESSLPNLKKGS